MKADVFEPAFVLKRRFNVATCVSHIINAIIGAGIFLSPREVVRETGSPGLVLTIWLLGGVLLFMEAFCYAELGLTLPKSGGEYTYLRVTYGDITGFAYSMLIVILMFPGGVGLKGLAVSEYILQPIFPDCAIPQSSVQLLSIVIVWLLCFINCLHIHWGSWLSIATTSGKLLALFAIIGAGFYFIIKGGPSNSVNVKRIGYVASVGENISTGFEDSNTNPKNLVFAIFYCTMAYRGASAMNIAVEEIRNHKRTLPMSIFISAFIVMVVYLLANAAYLIVLSKNEILGSNALGIDFASKISVWLKFIIPCGIVISFLGNMNVTILLYSRIMFVLGRDEMISNAFLLLNVDRKTPQVAVVFLGICATVSIIIGQSVSKLLRYYSMMGQLSTSLVILCLIILRWRHPEWNRPLKIPMGIPVLYVFVNLVFVIALVYSEPFASLTAIILILSTVPVYWIFVKQSASFWNIKANQRKLIRILQKLFLSLPSEGIDADEE